MQVPFAQLIWLASLHRHWKENEDILSLSFSFSHSNLCIWLLSLQLKCEPLSLWSLLYTELTVGKWLLCFASQNFGLSPIKYTYVPCIMYNTILSAYRVYKTFKESYPGQVKPHTCQYVLWKTIKNKYICCLLVVLKSIMDRLHHTSLHRINRIHKCVNRVFTTQKLRKHPLLLFFDS